MPKKSPVSSRSTRAYETKKEAKAAAIKNRKKMKQQGRTTRYEVNMTADGQFKVKEFEYLKDKKGRLV